MKSQKSKSNRKEGDQLCPPNVQSVEDTIQQESVRGHSSGTSKVQSSDVPNLQRCKILAIDPSINRCGWAVIDNLSKGEIWDGSEATWKWGYWDLHTSLLSSKARELCDYIIQDIGGLNPDAGDILIAEFPQYFDSGRGQIAAKEGWTINLAALDFYVYGFFRLPWKQFAPVFPSQWKGNLSKEITRRRFFRELGEKKIFKIDHNTVDAVMILLHWCKTHGVVNQILNYSTNVASFEDS
jgi:hypothetical protein